jgi:hypothetical protein
MMVTWTLNQPFHNPRSDLVRKWRKAMAFISLLGSSTACTRSLTWSPPDEVVLLIVRDRNHHERHVPRQGRLPTHFV